jgi:hypothetical protein
MATNSTNSNYVNISNLPKAQIASDTDLLILETQNGTETIEFQNFNVVRTDIAGNATVIGNLSGNVGDFSEVQTDTLKVDAIISSGTLGSSTGYTYLNKFQTTNGIVVSADYVTGSPEYNALLALYNTLSANSSSAYKKVFEYTGTATIPNGTNISNVINVGGFPKDASGISVGSSIGTSTKYASFFDITPYPNAGVVPSQVPVLSGFTYYPGTGAGDDYILFSIGQLSNNSSGTSYNYGVRLVYFYN